MLDHMLFNKVPWFNVNQSDNEIKANGIRYVAFPPKVEVKEDYSVEYQDNMTYKDTLIKYQDCGFNGGGIQAKFKKGDMATCIGADGDYWVISDLYNYAVSSHEMAIVKKDLFIPKWGGKSLLKSLLHKALSLFRRQVVTC